jgi:hypothetical protein
MTLGKTRYNKRHTTLLLLWPTSFACGFYIWVLFLRTYAGCEYLVGGTVFFPELHTNNNLVFCSACAADVLTFVADRVSS